MTISSQIKQTLADLKGSQSTLRIYSLQCQNEDEKRTYQEAYNLTADIINDLEDRLKAVEFEEPQYKGF